MNIVESSNDSLFDSDIKEDPKPPPKAAPGQKAPLEDSAKNRTGQPDPRKKALLGGDEKAWEEDLDGLLSEDDADDDDLEVEHDDDAPAQAVTKVVAKVVKKEEPPKSSKGDAPTPAPAVTKAVAKAMAKVVAEEEEEPPKSSKGDAPTPAPAVTKAVAKAVAKVVAEEKEPPTSLKLAAAASTPPSSPPFRNGSVTAPPKPSSAASDAASVADDDSLGLSNSAEMEKAPMAKAPSFDNLLDDTYDDDDDDHDDGKHEGMRHEPALPPPLLTDSVDLSRRAGSRAKGGVEIDTRDGSKLDAKDAAAATVRFKEIEERNRPKGNDKPPAPMVTADEVNKAGLSRVDKRSGLDLPSPLQLFMKYDEDKTGGVNRIEFGQMLYDLDSLEAVPKKKRDEYIMREFAKADINSDDIISIDEFYLYFYSTLCFKFPVLRTGVNPGADLLNIYMKYCSVGKNVRCEELGSHSFTKLCVHTKLVNGTTVTRATCDIAWYRARAELEGLQAWKRKNQEYITPKMLYPQFLFALMYLAAKRRSGFQEVVWRILEHVNSLPMATNSDYLILRNNGTEEQLEEFLERPRGLPKPARDLDQEKRDSMAREAELAKSLRLPPSKQNIHASFLLDSDDESEGGDAPTALLNKGRLPNKASMDGLVAGGPADSTSTLSKSMRMQSALPEGFRRAGLVPMEVPGPDAVLPDYKSYFIQKETIQKWGLDERVLPLPRRGPGALDHPESLMAARELPPDELMRGLKTVFERYNQWEQGTNKACMDKIRFTKALRDGNLVCEQQGKLTTTIVEAIFYKVLPPASDSINFVRFIDALRHVATKLRISLNKVMEVLVLVGKPINVTNYDD